MSFKSSFVVSGMTCQSCVQKIKSILLKESNILDVEIDLKMNKLNIISDKKIEVVEIQQILPDKYQVYNNQFINKLKKKEKTKIEQLFPLFLIFTYVIMGAIALSHKQGTLNQFMLHFMGLFFIVFSFFKFLDIKGFQSAFAMYDPLAQKIKAYGFVYPFIEALLGILFLLQLYIVPILIISLVVLGITTVGVVKSVFSNKEIKCACLGSVLNLPMTTATLIENGIMLVMGMLMLFKV